MGFEWEKREMGEIGKMGKSLWGCIGKMQQVNCLGDALGENVIAFLLGDAQEAQAAISPHFPLCIHLPHSSGICRNTSGYIIRNFAGYISANDCKQLFSSIFSKEWFCMANTTLQVVACIRKGPFPLLPIPTLPSYSSQSTIFTPILPHLCFSLCFCLCHACFSMISLPSHFVPILHTSFFSSSAATRGSLTAS